MRFFAIGLRGVALCLLLLCVLLVSGNVAFAQALTVTTNPVSLAFGVPDGSTVSDEQLVTVNVSGGSVTLSGFATTDPTHFTISSNTCPSTPIAAGGSCKVGITFTPGGTGLKTASLTFGATGAPAGISVPLSGALGAINVFGETDVNPSGPGPFPVTYGSKTLSLSCPAGAAPTGTLSSTPDGLGYVLEDNYLIVAVNGTPVPSGAAPAGNVCPGPDNDGGNQLDCYSDPYRGAASSNALNGVNADSIASPNNGNGALDGVAAGIGPIDIHAFLSGLAGTTGSVSFTALDYGGWIAGSSVFLVTNCTTVVSITQPGTAATAPGGATYTFNGAPNATVAQVVDLSKSNVSVAGVNITITDSPITPTAFPSLVANTSFAVDKCFVMSGELSSPTAISNVAIASNVLTLTVASTADLTLSEQVGLTGLTTATFLNGATITITGLTSGPTSTTVTASFTHADYTSASDTGMLGVPACKQYQILCTTSTNSTPSGQNCPISAARDEFYEAVFNPAPVSTLAGTTLPLINGFPSAVAYPMATDTWPGGPCVFPDPTLAGVLCPQNFLTNFSSVGDPTYKTTTTTKNPNSTVIPTYGHPQQVTGVTSNPNSAGWNNTSSVTVNFSTQAPFLGTPAPNNFVPAPIHSVTYWVDQMANDTDFPPTSALLASPVATCPTPSATPPTPPTSALPLFTSSATLTNLSDGTHVLGYFSTDCAGTEELQFSKSTGNWAASFFTKTIQVDTTPPTITGPTLSPSATGNTYLVGTSGVTVAFTCADSGSGISSCTGSVPGGPTISSPGGSISTTTPGTYTFTVTATDVAGNTSTKSVTYKIVNAPADLFLVAGKLAVFSDKTGTYITYGAIATNFGPNAAQNVKITDSLPTGLTFVSGSFTTGFNSGACTAAGNAVTCTVGNLPTLFNGGIALASITVKVSPSAPNPVTNTIAISALNADPNSGNNSFTVKTKWK